MTSLGPPQTCFPWETEVMGKGTLPQTQCWGALPIGKQSPHGLSWGSGPSLGSILSSLACLAQLVCPHRQFYGLLVAPFLLMTEPESEVPLPSLRTASLTLLASSEEEVLLIVYLVSLVYSQEIGEAS